MKIKVTGNALDIIKTIEKFKDDNVEFELVIQSIEDDIDINELNKTDISEMNMLINREYNRYVDAVFNTIQAPNEMFTFIVKEKIANIKRIVFNVINGKEDVGMKDIADLNSYHDDIMDNLALHYNELETVNNIKKECVDDIMREVEARYQIMIGDILVKIKTIKNC